MSGYIGNLPSKNISRDVRNFISDGVTTTYSIDYVVGSLDVFHNGIHLDASQYIATNGTTVTFATGNLTNGDKLMFVSWHAFRIAVLPFVLQESITDPTINDDNIQGFNRKSRWYNTTTDSEFVCLDDSTGAAVWKRTTDVVTDSQRFYLSNI